MTEEFNMRAAMAKLTSEHLVVYLKSQKWEVANCAYEARVLLLGEEHSEGRYELMLPTTRTVKNYRTLLQRAVYKLCGIEEREPAEILTDVFDAFDRSDRNSPAANPTGQSMKIRNSSMTPLRVRLTSRNGEYELLPGEAVELMVRMPDGHIPEFEHHGDLLIIHDA